MNKILFKDSKGNKSVTMTVFVWGMAVVNLKLIMSGLTIGGVTLSQFGGGDYAAGVTALGAIYIARRHPAIDKSGEVKVEGKVDSPE